MVSGFGEKLKTTKFCKYCGKEINRLIKFCKYCGREINVVNQEKLSSYYAGFWIRLGAFLFDYVIIFILVLALGFFLAFFDSFVLSLFDFPVTVFVVAIIIIYHTFFLSIISSTPGKLAFGLKVVDFEEKKLKFGKALARSLSYILSSLFFSIGFLMIGFDKPKRQGLHDKIAKTLVIKEKQRNLALIIFLFILRGFLMSFK